MCTANTNLSIGVLQSAKTIQFDQFISEMDTVDLYLVLARKQSTKKAGIDTRFHIKCDKLLLTFLIKQVKLPALCQYFSF